MRIENLLIVIFFLICFNLIIPRCFSLYQSGVSTTTTTTIQPTTTTISGGGGGGAETIQSTGFYNFTNTVEIEIGSSKTIYGKFFSRDILRNVVFNIAGINESWYIINPSSVNETKSKETMNISITFTIPENSTLTTYPIEIVAKSGLFIYKKGLNLTLLAKSVITTPISTTGFTTITTTVPICASTGQACSSDLPCCSGYCCNYICSDKQCEKKVEFKKSNILLLIVIIFIGPTVGYFVYKKYIKKKIPIKTIPMFKEELISLRKITEDLKTKGYDVTECVNELNLAENYLNKNLKQSAIAHMDRATKIMERILE